MRIHKTLAVAASGMALAAAVTLPAVAGTSHGSSHGASAPSKTHLFPSTLTPHKVTTGTKMVLKGHGAKKNTAYSCVFTVLKGSAYWVGPIKTLTSSSKGKIKCVRTFKPYKANSLTGAAPQHCPLSHKAKKHGYRCALAVSTLDKTSATNQYFTAK